MLKTLVILLGKIFIFQKWPQFQGQNYLIQSVTEQHLKHAIRKDNECTVVL